MRIAGWNKMSYVERFYWYAGEPKYADVCWIWLGKVDSSGYARFSSELQTKLAHVYAYTTFVNPIIEDGCVVTHKCFVRDCVNPAHLESVPRNTVRKRDDSNRFKVPCMLGHSEWDENAFLTMTPNGYYVSCLTCRNEHSKRLLEEKERRDKLAEEVGVDAALLARQAPPQRDIPALPAPRDRVSPAMLNTSTAKIVPTTSEPASLRDRIKARLDKRPVDLNPGPYPKASLKGYPKMRKVKWTKVHVDQHYLSHFLFNNFEGQEVAVINKIEFSADYRDVVYNVQVPSGEVVALRPIHPGDKGDCYVKPVYTGPNV